jgi:hypothetical protein
MRSNEAHKLYTRTMFSNLDPRLIESINHQMDNPSRQQMMLTNVMNPNNRYGFGLNNKNHRKYNHDLLTGALFAAQYGPEGLQAFQAHIMGDYMRDIWTRTFGMYGADLMESSLMYNLHSNHVRRNRYKYRYRYQRRPTLRYY